jgi:hypothetical protein
LKTQFVRRWWCKKYNLPPTDARYLAYTAEDLLLELYEDLHEKNPAFRVEGELDEAPELEPTGDDLADEIERRLDRGEDVEDLLDLMEGQKPPPKTKAPPSTTLKTASFFKE